MLFIFCVQYYCIDGQMINLMNTITDTRNSTTCSICNSAKKVSCKEQNNSQGSTSAVIISVIIVFILLLAGSGIISAVVIIFIKNRSRKAFTGVQNEIGK